MGGLGNQLFQIFATISYAINNKVQFKFLNSETLGGGESTLRYTFWNSILSRLQPFLIDNFVPQYVIKEHDFTFHELESISKSCTLNILLFGYFQSYKYFEKNYEVIKRIIGLENKKNKLLTKLDLDLRSTISIHFRIGDYKKLPNYHPIMTKEYYFRALKYIYDTNDSTDYKVIYFCENENIDEVQETINFLQQHFKSCEFIQDIKLKDWEQMIFMSCCTHNIIANSSFSWWGAYLNSNSDKIVCYPSLWFGKSINKDTRDLCPSYWIKIDA